MKANDRDGYVPQLVQNLTALANLHALLEDVRKQLEGKP
jgi:hypothetical protein